MKYLQMYACCLLVAMVLPFATLCQDRRDDERDRSYRNNNNMRTHIGGAFTFAATTGNLSNVSDLGIGLHLLLDQEVTRMLSVTGNLGWTNFFGKDNFDGRSGFSLEAGSKVKLSLFYIEVRPGYYFGDLNQFTLTPAVGLRFENLDINVGYQLAGNAKWIPLRIGYYFSDRRR